MVLANQVSRPYTPVLVEDIVGAGTGLAASIGLVMGAASLVGALMAPLAGYLGDHIGFRPANVDSSVAAMKAKNVKVTTEPRPLVLPSGPAMRLAFIEGPGGIRIELVQRENLR